MSNTTYNGHKNWNHWNVSLWLGNDEGLYTTARACKRIHHGNLRAAAEDMLTQLTDAGITHTPDGAPYSVTTLRAAMRDL